MLKMYKIYTCDQTRHRRDLPILGPQIRVTPNRQKLPIYMNSDFSLLLKAKTCFPIIADACFYLNLQQEAAIDLYWFSATNKNQHFYRYLTGYSDCINQKHERVLERP